ncbi:HAD family hydrolase [Alkalihalobacillus sp. BA299]|uniref:HAD family hydrolase n=1 Tax=Alkalihalobacillus sp. BA299 TaxID=2815938 RepID=UPI001ADAB76B|nr:HAD family hydrolase [Alkalihalobacillus sp. BA299]
MKWVLDVKLIIFDLDGTLYEDNSSVSRFVEHLLVNTSYEKDIPYYQKQLIAILRGDHGIQLGSYYDPKSKYALNIVDGQVKTAMNWEGKQTEFPMDTDKLMYSKDHQDLLIYIGTPWNLFSMLTGLLELSTEKHQDAIRKLRYEMVMNRTITRHDRLQKTIRNLPLKKVLISNTYEASGKEFLTYLQLEQAFNEIIFSARKPGGMKHYIDEALNNGIKPHQILSIGDNWVHDLDYVTQVGGRTCWVNPYRGYSHHSVDIRVHNLDELNTFLQNFITPRENAV